MNFAMGGKLDSRIVLVLWCVAISPFIVALVLVLSQ